MSKTGPQFLIYGLIDPRSKLIRYIGLSSSGLTRARGHRMPSCPDTYCRRWVRTLQKLGLDYEITVLETVATQTALSAAERWWIAYGRGCGWLLTNRTDGGGTGLEAILKKRARSIERTNAEAARLRRFYPPEKIEEHRRTLGIPAEIERQGLQFFEEHFARTRGIDLIDAVAKNLCITQDTAAQLYEKWWKSKQSQSVQKAKPKREPERWLPTPTRAPQTMAALNKARTACIERFAQGKDIDEIILELGLAPRVVKRFHWQWQEDCGKKS